MDSQSIPSSSRNPSQLSWMNLSRNLLLAYQSFGVVYGDLSTSPLYVYTSTFKGKLKDHHDEETVFGVFSLIFWTITLIPLLKYVFIILSANDNGEGGTFALYSLLCRHAKFNLLPNQQAADEELSSYKYGPSSQTGALSPLKMFLEKHKRLRTVLLVVVLFGACMVIGDGVLSPAISVLASVSGLKVTITKFNNGELVLLACVILVGMFALQHCGTHRIAFMFAPIVIIWLLSIFIIGIYNTILWNPKIVFAISPHYIIQFFIKTGTEGWISLGGILLCITGAEAMFADLGHFTATSIRLAFAVVIYPCLVMQYMGQAAFLSKNLNSIQNSFYDSIPEPVFWPVFVIATLAAIVGSQASITATFSIIKQCHALDCFPRVKVVHTSKHMFGQIYIPEINWILMVLTLAVTIGFQDTTLIGNAYGLACMTVMFVTTFLMALVIVFVWQKSIVIATLFLLFFWVVEAVYLSAAFLKVHQGGWVPLVLSFFFLVVMYVWDLALELSVSPDWSHLLGTRNRNTSDIHPFRALLDTATKTIKRDDGTRSLESTPTLIASEQEDVDIDESIPSSRSITLRRLQSTIDDENPQVRKRRVKFQVPNNPGLDNTVKEEILDLIQAKEAGIAYIMGHSYVKARKSSSFLKKIVIDMDTRFCGRIAGVRPWLF
ncbi:unnamed protein product, partial [Vicia faba]